MSYSLNELLNDIRSDAANNRDIGDRFERLIAAFLTADPRYDSLFSDVWLWTDWPGRGNMPDTGIDLVAKERLTGGYCAIQCKFYRLDHKIQKSDIDSFFTASGKHHF